MPTDVTYRHVECSSALNRVKGMPFEWSLNPYKGCVHSCRYCFSRAYHARMDRDVGRGFDREIDVKINFVDVLRRELRRGRSGTVAIGTATDPYQPCEGRYRLTRGALEALVDRPMPISIITKSTLVVRDREILRVLSDRTSGNVRICFSIPTLDREVWRRAEPGTPPPEQRLRALRMVRDTGVDAGVLCAPVLPHLTDAPDSIDRVAREAHSAGATFFGWRPLKIDPEIRDYYFDFIASDFPMLTRQYQALYASGAHAAREYQTNLDALVSAVKTRYGFTDRWREPPREGSFKPTQLTLAI